MPMRPISSLELDSRNFDCSTTELSNRLEAVHALMRNNKLKLNLDKTEFIVFMSSLCGMGARVCVRLNNFSSKTTRPRDMLFFLKDTLSIEDEKLFKACKPVCSSVC